MNAANESSPAPSLRRLPFSVRLAPHFVNCLAAVLPEEDELSEKIEGLLFGMVEPGFSVLRMFHLSSPNPGLGRQANFEEALARSKKNPQLAGFTLLGWFSLRNGDEGLQTDDVAFHEQNFHKANDIALIVKVEPERELCLELFCGGVDGTFTDSSRRSGTIRVSSVSPVIAPLEVPMELHRDVHVPSGRVEPEIEEDDPIAFLREAFASGARKAIDVVKTSKPEGREDVPVSNGAVDVTATRNAGSGTSSAPGAPFATSGGAAAAPARIPSEAPQAAGSVAHDRETETVQDRAADIPRRSNSPGEIAAAAAKADAVLVRSEDPRPAPAAHHVPFNPKPALPQREPLPMQSNTAPVPAPAFGVVPARSGPLSRFSTQAIPALPWRKLAAIFVVVAGATFAFVYLRFAHANGTLPQFVQTVWPTPALDLKIAANGDRFQLSWNRNLPAVRNAREAVLDINDGPSRHQILLGNSELANGSVLYLPSSDDVMFRLQVHGPAGQKATESLRVIGTAKSSVLEVSRPSDTPAAASEPPTRTLASRRAPNENAKSAAVSRRPSSAAKPERGGSDDTRQSSSGTAPAPAPVGNEVLAKADVPHAPSPSSGPGPGTALEPAHPSPNSPAANTAVADPPQPSAAPGREAQAPPQSDSSAPPSAQKANTTESAQLSKPEVPVVPADNNAGKTAPLEQPAPSREQPAKPQPAKPDVAAAPHAVTYNPPRPLKQVLPKITALPPGVAESAGEVRVAVRVDESGRVIDARLVQGKNRVSSMLASASLMAARQWTFEPASLRGKNVASDHTIVFQFRH